MHSFRPSRARILFEVFCALALSASLGVAWVQTGASALLGAAAAAALFGLSHAFGMRRGAAVAAEPQRIDFAAEDQDCTLAEPISVESIIVEAVAVAEEEAELAPALEEAEVVTIAAAPESKPRNTKAPRKSRAARKPPKEFEIPEIEPIEATDVVVPLSFDELDQPRIEPLFEPEPFVRQPRAVVFGRKAG